MLIQKVVSVHETAPALLLFRKADEEEWTRMKAIVKAIGTSRWAVLAFFSMNCLLS
jgi:hypothetical protein